MSGEIIGRWATVRKVEPDPFGWVDPDLLHRDEQTPTVERPPHPVPDLTEPRPAVKARRSRDRKRYNRWKRSRRRQGRQNDPK